MHFQVEVPAVPFSDPGNYVHVAERLAGKLRRKAAGSRVFYANQWDNLANRQSHIDSTAPEIWQQLGGRAPDAFSCAMGTGGTLTGIDRYVRSSGSHTKVCLTDPEGAAVLRYYTDGELRSVGSSISEGIGQGRITGNMAASSFRPDWCFEVADVEMLPVLHALQSDEGIAVGTSAGVNVAGAIRVAERLGPGHTIVTMLCDRADRYATKLYNQRFLESMALPSPPWLDQEAGRVLTE